MWFSFVHSIKMCLIEYWFIFIYTHGHFGGGSSLRMKELVSRVCPMRSWVRVVSSLLVLLGSSFLSFKIGCIWKSLLWGFSSHNWVKMECFSLGRTTSQGERKLNSNQLYSALKSHYQQSWEYIDCILCRKKNFIWWWGSSSGDLESVSFSLLPGPLWPKVIVLVRVPFKDQIDLKIICIWFDCLQNRTS